MARSLVLVLVLAAAPRAAADAAAGGTVVRAVEIEAEHAEGLRALVPLAPGQPLEREAVRRAIELMHATGRFEDVPVDLVYDEDGSSVTVVFRPLPAPLLVGVRVEGDRVVSPRTAARMARLRPGEPLWPSRLDRAGRDIALALERRGHFEALASPSLRRIPGGAEAVFRIRAGPKVRVGLLAVESPHGFARLTLESLARPRRGEIYRKARADAAADQMRRTLVRMGRWRAAVAVQPTYDPGQATMDLVFQVEPGPRMSLDVRGATLEGRLVDEVRALVSEGGVTADTLAAGGERIEDDLRQRGHREPRVRARTETGALGEKVVYAIEPGPRAFVRSVGLRGADAGLLEGLRTRPGRPLVDGVLDEDGRTLQARLEARGHSEARVEIEVSEGGGPLDVVFVAQPGPRALVRRLEIVGPALPASSEDGPHELALREGLPYRTAAVARSRDTLLAAWRRAGYLDVRVRPEVSFSPGRDEAHVMFLLEPGSRTLVDHVVLAGLGRTQAETVEREMVLRPGEPFSFERVLESQRRLSALGIFERVSIGELDPQTERRDLVVSVLEAPRTSVSWGLGYSEQDRVRGSVELTRRNLGGVARSASVFARGSFRGSRLALNLREPWLFGRKLDSLVTGFWEAEDRSSFDYSRKGAIVQAGRAIDAHTRLFLRYLLQDTNVYRLTVPIDEIDRQYRTYAVSGPSASAVYDSRDDPLEPRRGFFLGADFQLSLAALRGESFLRGFLHASHVSRLRANLAVVLAGRLGLAEDLRADTDELPLPERFFAGGDFGPRGFDVDGVGPKDPVTGLPIGGNALVFGGAEMRLNLTQALQIASFLDVGNVYSALDTVAFDELRRSAGLGVRYRTPIGPIRLDWGYVLDRQDKESRSRFHLTIGHAF